MKQRLALTLGTFMVAGGILGASVTYNAPGVSAQATTPPAEERGADREQMHARMEGMMAACMEGMEGMMQNMDGMMNGEDGDHMMDTTTEPDETEEP